MKSCILISDSHDPGPGRSKEFFQKAERERPTAVAGSSVRRYDVRVGGRGGKPMGCRAIRCEDGPDLSERGTAMAPVGGEYAVGRDEKAPPSVPPADLRASLPKTCHPVAKGRENYGTAFDRSFTGTGGRNAARHSPVSKPDALRGKRRTAVRRRSTAEKRPPVP